MNDLLKHIAFKASSGRLFFTVVSAVVFAYCSFKGILNADQIQTVLMVVVAFYFNKKKENEQ